MDVNVINVDTSTASVIVTRYKYTPYNLEGTYEVRYNTYSILGLEIVRRLSVRTAVHIEMNDYPITNS